MSHDPTPSAAPAPAAPAPPPPADPGTAAPPQTAASAPPSETPPPAAPVAPPAETGEETLEALDAQAIELPGGDKLVPLAAVTTVREKLKETRQQLAQAQAGSARAAQLEAQVEALSTQLQQLLPLAQAYQAMLQAQATQPPAAPAALAEDPDALALAQDLDLYTPEGQPDVAKARRLLERIDARTQATAHSLVAPLQQQTVQQQSAVMLARAKQTVAPNGAKPDPQILEAIWSRLDPSLTATPQGAQQAWAVALGYSAMAGSLPTGGSTPASSTPPAPPPEPLYTEPAGGRATPGTTLPLDDRERRLIKELGLTEAEYLASTPPWMRRP